MGESIPVQLGRFRVDGFLGKGGMGAVYKARDPKLGREVALKTIRLDGEKGGALIERLYREAQACARLRHPAIVAVHDVVEADGVVFIVMEYLEGTSLSESISASGLSLDVRLGILLQVLDALDYAHGEGVVHRDIKPSNVHLLPDRRSVKLLDFGIAYVPQAGPLTVDGTLMGTPHYMSPEQLKGERVDPRTDIYSSSVLGYELLTRRRPFDGESVSEVMIKVANEPPPPMTLIWPSAPPELARIIARGMAKAADDRFGSAREMAHEIRKVAEGISSRDLAAVSFPSEVIEARSGVRDKDRPRHRAMMALALALGAVAVAGLWGVETSTPGRSAPNFAEQPDSSHGSQGGTRDQAATDKPLPDRRSHPEISDTKTLDASTANGAGAATDSQGPMKTGPLSAERLFYPGRQDLGHGSGKSGSSGAHSSSGAPSGIKYQVVQISSEGAEVAVDPEKHTFHAGDQIRLAFQPNIDGYLYVVQKGSSGNWDVLFPRPDINLGSNRVQRFREYLVPPPESDWAIGFDANPGTEHLLVFLSKTPVRQLPGFDRPLKETATLAQLDVDHLAAHVRARDLVWEKTTTPSSTSHAPSGSVTYVVNQSQLGDAVIATIDLTHR